MNLLQTITDRTRERVAAQKAAYDFPFERALRTACAEEIAFICEVKKASPSKGIIAHDFPHVAIAREYAAAGAAAVSVLTEPFYFHGSDRFLREIADAVDIPLLRKDFVVDRTMVCEAKTLGASAVLLICAVLDAETLAEYIALAHDLGLSALVEVHDEAEVETALTAGARILGVNNRNLKTFEVDLATSARLRPLVPPEVLFVSESGIAGPDDIATLRRMGAHAALVGETLMRAPDKRAALAHLRGGA